MSGAQSMVGSIGAVRSTRAPCPREPYRGGPGILAAAVILLLLAGTLAPAFADQQRTEQPTVEAPAIGDLLEEGITQYRAGQPARAVDVFLEAAQTDPDAADPWIWAGVAATAAGRMHDANQYFQRGLARPHTALQDRIIHGWLTRLTVFAQPAPKPPARPGTTSLVAALARASNPRLSAHQAEWLGGRLVAAARQQHLDPWLLAAVIYVESKFNQAAVSSRGAVGLGQLMPHTARADGVNPRDAWGNLLGTAMTLGACVRQFQDPRLALAAYNAGSAAVYRYRGVPPFAETRWYVSAVLEVYQRIHPAKTRAAESH